MSIILVHRCPVYTELPSFCTLDTVPGDCCKKLNCPHVVPVGTTTTPKPTRPSCEWCKDTLATCESYGQQACVAPYVPWAKRNCPNYCNLCGTLWSRSNFFLVPGYSFLLYAWYNINESARVSTLIRSCHNSRIKIIINFCKISPNLRCALHVYLHVVFN